MGGQQKRGSRITECLLWRLEIVNQKKQQKAPEEGAGLGLFGAP